MTDSLKSGTVYRRQERIATLAKQSREFGFLSLNHHFGRNWLETAFARTRKDGAVGVNRQTAADYSRDLEGNLESLLDRAKSGT